MSGALVSTIVSSKRYGTERVRKGAKVSQDGGWLWKQSLEQCGPLRAGGPATLWASTSCWLPDVASSPNSAYCARREAFLRKGQAVM